MLLSDQVTRFLAFLASFSMEMTAHDGKGAGVVWFGATEGLWVLLVSLSHVLPESSTQVQRIKMGPRPGRESPRGHIIA